MGLRWLKVKEEEIVVNDWQAFDIDKVKWATTKKNAQNCHNIVWCVSKNHKRPNRDGHRNEEALTKVIIRILSPSLGWKNLRILKEMEGGQRHETKEMGPLKWANWLERLNPRKQQASKEAQQS